MSKQSRKMSASQVLVQHLPREQLLTFKNGGIMRKNDLGAAIALILAIIASVAQFSSFATRLRGACQSWGENWAGLLTIIKFEKIS